MTPDTSSAPPPHGSAGHLQPLSAHPCGVHEDGLLHDSRTAHGGATWCDKQVRSRGYDVPSPTAACPTCAAQVAGLDRDLILILQAHGDHTAD